MITELITMSVITFFYQKANYKKDEKAIIKKFDKIMVSAGIKNKEDTSDTFKIISISKTKYGFRCSVKIADGMDLNKLENMKTILQDNLKCLCEINKDRFSNCIDVKIITNPLNNLTFKVEKSKPYEILLGYTYDGTPVFLNLNKLPHLLIGGCTGTGKSRLVYTILTNLIANHSYKKIELYLTQIRKKDLKHFKNCEQVKQYAENLIETRDMFARIDKTIERRTEIIDNKNCDNIEEYNKINKVKMKYLYVFAEEFSFYMEDKSDNEDTAKLKASTLQYLKNIICSGRSVG